MANEQAVLFLERGGEDWAKFQKTDADLDFTDANIKDFNLSQRVFQRAANFDRATFEGIELSGTQFQKGATFRNAKFRKFAEIRPQDTGQLLDFSEAEFFDAVRISQPASGTNILLFTGAKFHKKLIVEYAPEGSRLDFSNAKFLGDVAVRKEVGSLSFAGAKFGIEKPVRTTFRGVKLHRGVEFTRACFLGPADFENVEFQGSSSFVECTFHVAPNFHDAKLHQGTTFSQNNAFPRLFRDTQSPGASNAYRTLKLAMSDQHALSEELGFFLLEMRSTEPFQSPWIRPLYRIYDFVSLYGLSVKRPLALFVVFNIAVGLLLSWLAGRGWGWWAWDSELLALTLYGAIPFAPALRTQVPEMSSLFPSTVQTIVPVIVALQGLLNAALLFLVLLGLRNMFKIK